MKLHSGLLLLLFLFLHVLGDLLAVRAAAAAAAAGFI